MMELIMGTQKQFGKISIWIFCLQKSKLVKKINKSYDYICKSFSKQYHAYMT